MDYPQLYFSESFKKIIESENFEKESPVAPTYPKYHTGLFSLFTRKNKTLKDDYLKELAKFNIDNNNYKKEKKIIREIGIDEFNNQKKLETIQRFLSNSWNHINNKDYKKGYWHDEFKDTLQYYFKNRIFESISIKNSDIEDYEDKYFTSIDLYVTDLAYIENNIKIDIEIDEPYTFKTQRAIHLDDNDRNLFFLQHNWFIIRFCEEQVIHFPDECIKVIENYIRFIKTGNMKYYYLSKNSITNLPKWNESSVKKMIHSNYREKYIALYSQKLKEAREQSQANSKNRAI